MNRIFYSFIALLVVVSACNKGNDAGPGNGTQDQLIPASTGWRTVSSVPYVNTVSGEEGKNAMTPYDLTMTGNELALLYSDDYQMSGVGRHTIMKLMLNNGTVDAKAKAVTLNYDRGANDLQVHRFIPGTFTTLSARFLNNDCLLYDEHGGPNAGQAFGSINALPTVRWYADGSVLAGLNDGPHSSTSWAYKYPATGSFSYVVNVWNGDSVSNMLSSPMKLTDGMVYDLVFGKRNGTVYFSVMKNLNPAQPGAAPNYELISRNTVPGLDAAKTYAIVTSDVQGDAQTIVLAEVDNAGGNVVYTKLHALRWKKGATTMEALYSVAITDDDMGRKIRELTTNISFPNEVRLTPDGTAYFLREYQPSQGGGGTAYTSLAIIGKDGVKEIGKINVADMHAIRRGQYAVHTCRYFNGSYYAVVHPMEEYDYDKNAPEFRIEVMKINP